MKITYSLVTRFLLLLGLLNATACHNLNFSEKESSMKNMVKQDLLLFPMPQSMVSEAGAFQLRPDSFICLPLDNSPQILRSGEIIQAALENAGQRMELTAAAGNDPDRLGVVVSLKKGLPHGPESYRLKIGKDRIEIQAGAPVGVFRAAMTLKQIARQRAGAGKLPCLTIEDWPDFANRGVMLDISRDKVPQMKTLYQLVDLFSEFKINQFQLYTEHTFAYRDHKDVWGSFSPMTSEEILKLDAYCRERFIELVPNQASFGHVGRWLWIPRYSALAEVPENPRPARPEFINLTFCPTNPDVVKLLDEMYAELLPNFTSRQFNVGCDETWGLGTGRSKKFVKNEEDVGRLYLSFLLKIHKLVKKNGRTMQFWGDIILKHPDLIANLPKDVIALDWGYEWNHPYNTECPKFAKAGIPFYVCPGTSAWCSIVGRTDNMRQNLWNAAENGKKYGAIGYLNTSWGDAGHWDHLPVVYGGFIYGAAVSWAGRANKDIDLARGLDEFVFNDQAGVMGKLMLDLGNSYREAGCLLDNQHVLWYILFHYNTPRSDDPVLQKLDLGKMQHTLSYLDDVMKNLPKAKIANPEAELIAAEVHNNAAMVRHACLLEIARIKAGGAEASKLPVLTRRKLASDLRSTMKEFKRLWLIRNRVGGLDESVRPLEQLLAAYEGKAKIKK